MKFNIGDKFVYEGNTYPTEVGRVQIVFDMIDGMIYSSFIDNDVINIFEVGMLYYCECIKVNQKNNLMEYDNGIPYKWEDIIWD